MIIKITVLPRILIVSAEGEFSLEAAKSTFLDIIDAIEHNQSERVLLDGREIDGNPTVIERFYYGEFVADSVDRLRQSPNYEGPPTFGYVLREPMLDPLRLGETVAVNRGVSLKAFEALDEAIKWLDIPK